LSAVEERAVRIPAEARLLAGDLVCPARPRGVVVFAHGSGSSRLSPRNRYVARRLQEAGFATLLLDLLTPDEDEEDLRTGRLRFDVALLGRRLLAAVVWAAEQPSVRGLPLGLFGASTGAAAALRVAADAPERVAAVVSRGGRPDLAHDALPRVRAPTLLVVGGADELVLRLNEEASRLLRCEKQLAVVPGAGHLFEEPGALEQVATLAADWFARHLWAGPAGSGPQ
jgi:putative phosphoribosyl transferase